MVVQQFSLFIDVNYFQVLSDILCGNMLVCTSFTGEENIFTRLG